MENTNRRHKLEEDQQQAEEKDNIGGEAQTEEFTIQGDAGFYEARMAVSSILANVCCICFPLTVCIYRGAEDVPI